MEGLMKGDIVVVPFPYADFSSEKRRPALIVAKPFENEVILTEITSKPRTDACSISITDEDLQEGHLKSFSVVRTNKIATLDKSIVIYKMGAINETKLREVEKSIIRIIRSG